MRITRSLGAMTGAATLAVAVLAAAPPASASGPSAARPGEAHPLARVALVPLDDRPVNLLAPAATASLAGLAVTTPPRDLLGRFTTPGDPVAVGQWLTSQKDADAYVVSTSMLAYGGLVASRTAAMSEADARSHIQPIKAVRQAHPDKPLYVFDTIQRLALTGLTVGGTDYATLVREWAILYDQVVNLGMTQYQAQLDAKRAQIPDEVLADYLAARQRNHDINEQMVRWVADGTIDDLVLGEDDTAPYGLERAERVQLEQLVAQLGVGDRVQIFPGADEIDALLVARYVLTKLNVHPSVAVQYAGVNGSAWTAALEDIPFADNITRHLAALGLKVDPASPVHLLVNTPSAAGADRGGDLDKLVAQAADLLAQGKGVIVDDPIIVNKADHDLVTRMQDRLPLLDLLGYSGWNTGGNSLGLTLAEGLSRYAFLESTRQPLRHGITPAIALSAANAHVEYLLKRFIIDDRWKNDVQPAAIAYGQSQGWNTNNLTDDQYAPMNQWVVDHLTPVTQDYFDRYFGGRRVLVGYLLGHPVTARVASLDSVTVHLPWPRLFETELQVSTSLKLI
ncbi:DUF4127 family protein [Hamadaea sp. NPDC051192]|uniref:DUF4127 family protein n=1 Tax=Hamadaea sp. NPDC051192 TaxID=3154940 RepID=UPI003442A561